VLSEFQNVSLFPLTRTVLVASQTPLRTDITTAIAFRGIQTVYFNNHYINDLQLSRRSDAIVASLQTDAALNTDFNPLAYFHQLELWTSMIGSWSSLVIFLIVLILAVILTSHTVETFSMFAVGYMASTIELCFLAVFQVLLGMIYQMIGLITMIFMFGLFLGANNRIAQRFFPSGSFKVFVFISGFIGLFSPFLWNSLSSLKTFPLLQYSIILMALCITGVLVGSSYRAATSSNVANPHHAGGIFYSADLIGSAIGAFSASIIFIPLLGLTTTSILSGMLCFIAALFLQRERSPSRG
jgi:predicted membrane-bound spermidine synthase